jgi:hypothetical protein
MAERSTLLKTADIIIRRVLADVDSGTDLAEALNKAYPFGDDPEERQIWLEALIRIAVKDDTGQTK